MALQKDLTLKGITGSYWRISDKNYNHNTDKTTVLIQCYVSKTVRDESLDNYIALDTFQVIRPLDGELTLGECYEQLKISNIVDEVEQNFFTDALDIKENEDE